MARQFSCCSCRGPKLHSVQFLVPELAGSQPLVTPALGDLLASSGLHGYLALTYAHIIKNTINFNKKSFVTLSKVPKLG